MPTNISVPRVANRAQIRAFFLVGLSNGLVPGHRRSLKGTAGWHCVG